MFKLNVLVSSMSKQFHCDFDTPLLELKHRLKMVVASILLLVAVIGITELKNSEFTKVDTCLDNGGRYNYEQGECEY